MREGEQRETLKISADLISKSKAQNRGFFLGFHQPGPIRQLSIYIYIYRHTQQTGIRKWADFNLKPHLLHVGRPSSGWISRHLCLCPFTFLNFSFYFFFFSLFSADCNLEFQINPRGRNIMISFTLTIVIISKFN